MNLHGQEITVSDRIISLEDRDILTTVWSIFIHKPEHDTTVSIRDQIIEKAIKAGALLEVKTQGASEVIEPKLWKKESKIIYHYFKDPKHPMKLYERRVGGNDFKDMEELHGTA